MVAWGEGGLLEFEWIPNAKWLHGAEVLNAKIWGWSARFGAKIKRGGGSQL